MILLPVGHEEDSVRRLPIVTFSIIGLCLLVFFLTGRGSLLSDDDIELNEQAGEAIEFYFENPRLELDDEFEIMVAGEANAIESEYRSLAEAMPGQSDRPWDQKHNEAQQAQLDELTDAALSARDKHAFFRFGLIPSNISIVGLFLHMFTHAGWLHLIGNLLILYLAGPFVEDRWGRPLYAGFYLGCGLLAASAHIATQLDSVVPLVGASGAIAGVMGAFLVLFNRTKIKFFYMIGVFIRGTFDAAAWIMLPLWFVEQIFFGLLSGRGSAVAYWAHVGGFAAGALGAIALQRSGWLERYVEPGIEIRASRSLVDRQALDDALQAQADGDHQGAFDLFLAELQNDPSSEEVAALAWEAAIATERTAEASEPLLHSIETRLQSGQLEGVLELWSQLSQSGVALNVPATTLLRLTRLQVGEGDTEEARRTLRRALLACGRQPTIGLAMKLARLAIEIEPPVAKALLRQLQSRTELSVDDRAQLESLLAEV